MSVGFGMYAAPADRPPPGAPAPRAPLGSARVLGPGDTLGIIGGGQLGRMLALAARRLELRVIVQDPDPAGPAAQVADAVVTGAWDDARSARQLAERCQVLTVDTEHVPFGLLEPLEALTLVRPGARVLQLVQDRLLQRRFIQGLGLAQPAFAAVDGADRLREAAAALGVPAVLKARAGGYDGRGQQLIRDAGELALAASAPFVSSAVLEAFVNFECELSIVLARGADGALAFYPIVENQHRAGALLLSHAPVQRGPGLQSAAERIGAAIAEALGHVGVLAVELYLLPNGELWVNEIAPRTHNSGHLTLGACETSQFEQHVRAIAGWGLGAPRQHSAAAMLNLYGELWASGAPDWSQVLRDPRAHLHLYGKAGARPGRKMGHVLLLADEAQAALDSARALCERLYGAAAGARAQL